MSYCAGNEVVFVGIRALNEEFGHAQSYRSALDVLAQRPPAEVVDLFHVLVGTFKQRDVLAHPFRRLAVGYVRNDVLVLHVVEVFGIVCEVVILQHC